MASAKKLKMDLSFLSKSPLVKQVSHQWTGYEDKVKEFVSELNLKSRDAREKSKQQLDKFATQLKSARVEVEKRVHDILDQEAKVLNKGFTELVTYLKSLSKQEANVKESAPAKKPAAKASAGKKAQSAKTAGDKKTSAKKAKRSVKTDAASKKANGSSEAVI